MALHALCATRNLRLQDQTWLAFLNASKKRPGTKDTQQLCACHIAIARSSKLSHSSHGADYTTLLGRHGLLGRWHFPRQRRRPQRILSRAPSTHLSERENPFARARALSQLFRKSQSRKLEIDAGSTTPILVLRAYISSKPRSRRAATARPTPAEESLWPGECRMHSFVCEGCVCGFSGRSIKPYRVRAIRLTDNGSRETMTGPLLVPCADGTLA